MRPADYTIHRKAVRWSGDCLAHPWRLGAVPYVLGLEGGRVIGLERCPSLLKAAQAKELRRLLQEMPAESMVVADMYATGAYRSTPVAGAALRTVLAGKASELWRLRLGVYDQVGTVPYVERVRALCQRALGLGLQTVQVEEPVLVTSEQELAVCLREFLRQGAGGAYLHHGAEGYRPGLSRQFLRLAARESVCLVVDLKTRVGAQGAKESWCICEWPGGEHYLELRTPGEAVLTAEEWTQHPDWYKRVCVRYYFRDDQGLPVEPAAWRWSSKTLMKTKGRQHATGDS
jgi:hypothetical protein